MAAARRAFFESGVYFKGKGFGKGKGHGGKGKGKRRGNPIGPDGQQMKCSNCGSTEHFWRQCPLKGKGKGGNSTSSLPTASSP